MVATPVTLLLKLASNMTLPSYEGYVGGSREMYAIVVGYANGSGLCIERNKCGLTYLQITQWVPLMPLGVDEELGHYLVKK